MKYDVVEAVAEGRAHVSWSTVRSTYKGKTLVIWVTRDAVKFDGVPALTWDWKSLPKKDPWYTDEIFDGVRLPASALELQRIADLMGSMLLTPKVVDLIWLQAGLKFDCITQTQSYPDQDITNDRGVILAESHIHVVHKRIEAALAELGGDDGHSLISCVGKYWVLINNLATGHTPSGEKLLYGLDNACNYGWCAQHASGPGITPGVQCWQRPGFKHNHHHWDPSQTIRVMYRKGVLIHEDGSREIVDLHTIAASEHAGLLHHQTGELIYLRQQGEPKPVNDVTLSLYAPRVVLAA